MKLIRCERYSHHCAADHLRGDQDGGPGWRQRLGRHRRRQSRRYGDRQRDWRGVGERMDVDTIGQV